MSYEFEFTQKELKQLIDDCRIINPKNPNGKTVAFIGDSHTLALMEAQKKYLMKVTISYIILMGLSISISIIWSKKKNCLKI